MENIVNHSKTISVPGTVVNLHTKNLSWKVHASATLSMELSLLYLFGNPDNGVKKLADKFQKKMTNKLALGKRLYFLIEINQKKVIVHKHVKAMMEIFKESSVIGVGS